MEKKKIRDLAKGEYFILNPIEEPNASQVLEEMDPQAPVMVAVQPSWPFEHSITGVINAQNGTVSLSNLI